MSRQLVSRSADLQLLESEGYAISFPENHLLVKVPYVNAQREVVLGALVSELTLQGDAAAAPSTHVVYFIGATPDDVPCDAQGSPLHDLINQAGPIDLGGGLVASCSFSHKPDPTYSNYHEKMSTYSDMVVAYAQAIDSEVTAKTFPPIATDEDESVFRYRDSATTRARIGAVSDKLRLGKIVIVGLGGTGSYILDLVAKTPVQQIDLYDRDIMLTHNAFRSPGAATLDELNAGPRKVHYLQAKYDAMHRNVVAHAEHLGAANIDELRDAAFVFLSIDASPAKKFIIEKLHEFGVPFVDTGMGVYQTGDSLGGIVRTTTSTAEQTDHVWAALSFADEDEDEYEQNIQIADLNMLNAALAVIRWKKLFGVYLDFEHEFSSTYTIDGNHMLNEDQPG
jgi:hypothetical protein